MPWEKSFNEDTAVENAMAVFWEKGYDAASISELLKAVKMSKGSFYNAFGSKRDLFLRSLDKYESDRRRVFLSQLEAMDDPVQAIHRFFDTIVNEMLTDETRKGCFLINTSLELVNHDQQINDLVKSGIAEIEAFFKRCIEVGQAREQIPHNLTAETTAKILLSLAVSIRVLGRGGFNEKSLRVIAHEAKTLVTGPDDPDDA
ncbi:TetR/AcrR family transcriptional regulator [Bermanella marisrubri]|uniref:HTH tetR-type domain-containing protein n=1 Tax=Bermanella marisrubri TaxID=207949 RepID=Q1N1J6_9GAMM|nr:TetR/AcrR family transcriptional regulator [Bermanella marisrubri]EAT12054.1 hypothetical protein RED65_03410 [Oceanobacter sp. RED65] [Bermanella marisrubri]QIZ83524.1 TetR/AcrR family transcriptional regulator [Bermanella marisrubri]